MERGEHVEVTLAQDFDPVLSTNSAVTDRPRFRAFSRRYDARMLAEIYPLQVLLLTVSGVGNRHQANVIAYLVEENHVLKEQFGGKVPRLNDDQRRRLAAKAKLWGGERSTRWRRSLRPTH